MRPTTTTPTTFCQVSSWRVYRTVTVLALGSHWAHCAFETREVEVGVGTIVLGSILRSTLPASIVANILATGNKTTGT